MSATTGNKTMDAPSKKTAMHERQDGGAGAGASSASASASASSSSLGGMRLTADFLSPIVVGIFLGFWLDRWLATTPLFLLVLFFLGIAAGFWNLYRMAKRMDEQARCSDR